MNATRPGQTGGDARRTSPKYARLLLPAVMATVMSLVMSLVETIARLGFAPDLVGAWLTSFAIGVAVAVPTAILVAPLAQRLVGQLTGAPQRLPTPGASPHAASDPVRSQKGEITCP